MISQPYSDMGGTTMMLVMDIDLVKLRAALIMAAFLTIVVNRLVDMLIKPIFERQEWDKFYLMYVSWGLGTLLVSLTNINIFFFIDWRFPVVGTILTGVVAGGGSNLLHDVVDSLLTTSESFERLLERQDE